MAPSDPFPVRASTTPHALSNYLLRLMTVKRSNLALSADVTTTSALLCLADSLGPSIVVFKTHYDLVSNWDYNPHSGTGVQLQRLARKHGFLIFEDRKFGDIGHTVQAQFVGGSARICDWAHIVNVNMVPGKAVVDALAQAAAKWRERKRCEVRTLISGGNGEQKTDESPSSPTSAELSTEAAGIGFKAAPLARPSSSEHDADPATLRGSSATAAAAAAAAAGRKASIVSITTLSQSFERADSPRLRGPDADAGETFAGIEAAPLERGLLILAQMSSAGNFMDERYTQACVAAAREHPSFVMGFVAQQDLNAQAGDSFVTMAPGCQLPPAGEDDEANVEGDGKGQTYNTPQRIVGTGVDIVIVGRGIYNAIDPREEAERYRKKAWEAYEKRVGLQ